MAILQQRNEEKRKLFFLIIDAIAENKILKWHRTGALKASAKILKMDMVECASSNCRKAYLFFCLLFFSLS